MSAKRRTRIPVRIGRDDVRVDIDDWNVHARWASVGMAPHGGRTTVAIAAGSALYVDAHAFNLVVCGHFRGYCARQTTRLP